MAVSIFISPNGELSCIYIFMYTFVYYYFLLPRKWKTNPWAWMTLFYTRRKNYELKNLQKNRARLTDIINLRVMVVFFWRSPTWQLILDTCTRLLFHLSAAVNPRRPSLPPICKRLQFVVHAYIIILVKT